MPLATYRVQLHGEFTFRAAQTFIPYWSALGIGDLYCSPILQAREGSTHGYDVTDPTRVRDALGGAAGFAALSDALAARDMGVLLDIVPNHLCADPVQNPWWRDVLQLGQGSPHARDFDIDWRSDVPGLHGRVLLPVLGRPLADAVAAGELQVEFAGQEPVLRYHAHVLPLAPGSWGMVLLPGVEALARTAGEAHPTVQAGRGLVAAATSLRHVLPGDVARALPGLRQRLADWWGAAHVADTVHGALAQHVAQAGIAWWQALLDSQCYRLAHWRVAAEEINYRRFFDINELIAVRVEQDAVFRDVHEAILPLVRQGRVSGLRIDHVDGLADPGGYLHRLRAACGPDCRIVVEKVLAGAERPPAGWPVDGTTGYGFLNDLNDVFVQPRNRRAMLRAYRTLTGVTQDFTATVHAAKHEVLRRQFSGALRELCGLLRRIAATGLPWQDLTPPQLQRALAALIAAFPVYRSYLPGQDEAERAHGRQVVQAALAAVRQWEPDASAQALGLLEALLLDAEPSDSRPADACPPAALRSDFVTRFQQLTGPVMAKGHEDTALYRWVPLLSLNEVGSDPGRFGLTPAAFHRAMGLRQRDWPRTVSMTSSHDTKRSEDVRARLNVLSEMPVAWGRAVRRWRRINAPLRRRVHGHPAPSPNDEYLFYQSLLGIWPIAGRAALAGEDVPARLAAYMEKALREAMQHTDWEAPDADYESAVRDFVAGALESGGNGRFLRDLEAFATPVIRAGLYNSLSQTLVQLAAPGVPDLHQGCELWDFSLVDPDNRRPVDLGHRARLLDELLSPAADEPARAREWLARPADGRIKLLVTQRVLCHRRAHPALYLDGRYRGLRCVGRRAEHVVAFARTQGRRQVVAVSGRFFLGLPTPPVGRAAWGRTRVALGRGRGTARYRDLLTGAEVETHRQGGQQWLHAAEALAHLPVALLERLP